jgi:DnaK suppressor protein
MSTNELTEFKNQLLSRKEQILSNIRGLREDIGGLQKSEANDEADFATISSDSLVGEVLSQKQQLELTEIEYIFKKIEDGTYGICEMCEEHIGMNRLRVKPHARYCIDCREIVEKASPKNGEVLQSIYKKVLF